MGPGEYQEKQGPTRDVEREDQSRDNDPVAPKTSDRAVDPVKAHDVDDQPAAIRRPVGPLRANTVDEQGRREPAQDSARDRFRDEPCHRKRQAARERGAVNEKRLCIGAGRLDVGGNGILPPHPPAVRWSRRCHTSGLEEGRETGHEAHGRPPSMEEIGAHRGHHARTPAKIIGRGVLEVNREPGSAHKLAPLENWRFATRPDLV